MYVSAQGRRVTGEFGRGPYDIRVQLEGPMAGTGPESVQKVQAIVPGRYHVELSAAPRGRGAGTVTRLEMRDQGSVSTA